MHPLAIDSVACRLVAHEDGILERGLSLSPAAEDAPRARPAVKELSKRQVKDLIADVYLSKARSDARWGSPDRFPDRRPIHPPKQLSCKQSIQQQNTCSLLRDHATPLHCCTVQCKYVYGIMCLRFQPSQHRLILNKEEGRVVVDEPAYKPNNFAASCNFLKHKELLC